jgi:hypothetical protein
MRTPQHGTQTVKTHNRTTQTNWAARTSPRSRLETHVNYNNADHPVVMRSLCCIQVKKRYRIISFWEGDHGNQLLCMCLLGVSILPRLLRFSIRFLHCPDGVVFYAYFSANIEMSCIYNVWLFWLFAFLYPLILKFMPIKYKLVRHAPLTYIYTLYQLHLFDVDLLLNCETNEYISTDIYSHMSFKRNIFKCPLSFVIVTIFQTTMCFSVKQLYCWKTPGADPGGKYDFLA